MKSNLKVKLVSYTQDPEKLVAASAKLCYSQFGGDEIMEDLTDENIEKFLNILMSYGHQSPIEHISFSFAIEGVSRTLTHQLVRHRIASYSQKSQRYVTEGQFQYIVPPAIQTDEKAKKIFIEAMENDQKSYDKIANILKDKYIKEYINEGFSEKKAKSTAEKRAIEDARYVLPNACETKIMVTMNARTLLHFFNVRCCNRAQWEIRDMAEKMLIEVKKVAPNIFKNAGPSCVGGACVEGNMTCGKAKEMREKFLEI
ncbi:FAD-dependent thymidylate synthase [Sedimentibacter sp. zth1]|uniref:FAD-dependent thymidylate synthase n=1 Tax=Sedimentibacter sp. zth1 TaxID=2816908 RepID=UPI001A917765|nr:FAD-dependent thymidylate synthase [Sedimentibacter sp. zth1]QSX06359.1 FAD-dependent thymidylate synthase [Sedimentibacter sp. zth1]